MQFHFPRLAVSAALVVTSDQQLRPRMAARLAELQERLRAGGVELQ